MSVDWEFCIVHEASPNLSVDEMLKLLGHLQSAGYLENVGFKGFREADEVALESLEAVSGWLNTDPGKWDTVSCQYKLWGLGRDETVADRYPAFAKLMDELMDASVVANDSGAASPVYGIKISPGGLSMHMEGYSDDEKFLAELDDKPAVRALLEGASAAVGRGMKMAVMESIAWKREIPEEEVLARIRADIESGMAGASDEFKALVTLLAEPVQRDFDTSSKHPRLNYRVVTEEFEHNGCICVAAYDPSVTCWYLARPVDKPDASTRGYYPYSFGGFVQMIQQELDA